MEPEILVGGFKLGVLAILFVQALKILGLTEENQLKIAVVSVASFFTLLWGVEQLVPAAAPYVGLVVLGLSSIASCVLGYSYAVAPIAKALGVKISSGDLEE